MSRGGEFNDLHWAILARIEELYPCQAIPYGGLARVASEFGVTREYVRQIANRHGATGRLRKQRPPRPCKRCGLPVTTVKKQHCDTCLNIPLVCDYCGITFTRSAATIILNRRKQGVKGRFSYCSAPCRSQGLAHGDKHTGPRRRATTP